MDLTSFGLRVMYVRRKEVPNGTGEQKPGSGDPPGSALQGPDLLSRGRGDGGRPPLPAGGRPRVQEPLGGRGAGQGGGAPSSCGDAGRGALEAAADPEPATCPKGHQPDGSPAESAV